jgi:hypothetical protein
MEMDAYKSRFLDGCPDGYGTILCSFLIYLGLKGDLNFLDLVIFSFWCEDITVRINHR